MAYTDDQLIELRKKLSGRDNLYKTIRTLSTKKKEIEERLKPLEQSRDKERSDVEKLERGGIKSFFYSLTGQKVERLNKEKDEAYEADKKYEAVYKEYSTLCDTLDFYLNEVNELNECESTLNTLIDEKKLAMKNAAHPLTGEIEQEEKQLSKIIGQTETIKQSVFAVEELKSSVSALHKIVENLYYATRDEGWEWRSTDFLTGVNVRDGRAISMSFSEQLKILEKYMSALTYRDEKIWSELKELRIFADRMLMLFSPGTASTSVQNVFEKTTENKDRVSSVEFALNELYNEKTEEYYGIKRRLTDTVIDAKL